MTEEQAQLKKNVVAETIGHIWGGYAITKGVIWDPSSINKKAEI